MATVKDSGSLAIAAGVTTYVWTSANLATYLSAPTGSGKAGEYDQLTVGLSGGNVGETWDFYIDQTGAGVYVLLYDGLPQGAFATHGPRCSGTSTGAGGPLFPVAAWKAVVNVANPAATWSLTAEVTP